MILIVVISAIQHAVELYRREPLPKPAAQS
jgi:hypothetical protein